MTLTFVTFGSHATYIDAANRLSEQAKELEIFDEIKNYNSNSLKNDPEFWDKHKDFCEKNRRGYGYWLWKPYLIKKTMEQMKDGDIVLYLDCGCEIDVNEKSYLNEMIDIVKTDKIIGAYTHNDKDWNKMDLILKLDMNDINVLTKKQHKAGALMFLVCDTTRNIVNEWYNIGCDYHNIDDSPSISNNLDCFREHRHDQAIFSLLTKKHNVYSKSCLCKKCIKYIRNKSGITKLKK